MLNTAYIQTPQRLRNLICHLFTFCRHKRLVDKATKAATEAEAEATEDLANGNGTSCVIQVQMPVQENGRYLNILPPTVDNG